MPFEDRLAQSMRDTGEDFAPRDLVGLVNGGVTDGRKRRRRRNVAVLGGSAALALVAVGGAMVPSLLNTTGAHHVAGPAAQPKMSLTASAKPVSDGELAKQMIDTLKGLLPSGGRITDATGRWVMPGGRMLAPLASLVYDDGHGASAIEVGLTHNRPGGQLPSCANPAYAPNDVCHTYRLPGGAWLYLDQGYEYPSHGYGTKDWHATLIKADGSQIDVDEWNAAAEKGAPVTRATPPLSADQLRALATSTAWRPLLAALPAPKPIPPRPSGLGPDGGAILRTLNGLLPHGVTGHNPDSQSGYAEEQLRDGKAGAGLIGVNVQLFNSSEDAGIVSQLFAGATTLPDGSRMVVRQQAAEKGGSGAVQWVVDLIRPDGERVVAQEFNSPRQGVAADRSQPVLSIDQLKALVTDPAWTKLV
ncbi:hypothetical protein [Streptacidiphilus jiangxiensis]|uniref:Uncharacterized protein n=1 Tax=Streptacidiphilus jiangxiensis TaxID=235985 RepID=A0A1H7F0N5_STRJI|nr:hypothetical protein [Streptacidiphilus jiangxiensis]SEK19661.1 hypothetical protein SAMN05414137_10126 [Streptacidiphilus jiangxiensis]